MLLDEISALLRWPIRLITITSLAVAFISWGFVAAGHAEGQEFALLVSIATLIFVIGGILHEHQRITIAVAIIVAGHLVFGGILGLRFPDTSLSVAVNGALGVLLLAAITQRWLAYSLLGGLITLIALLLIRPLFVAPEPTLGALAVSTGLLSTLTLLLIAVILTRRLVARTRQTHQELAAALEQLQRTQSQLLRHAQDQAVSDLAVAAAHELSQPLTVVLNEAALLRETTPLTADADGSLANLYSAALRATQVLRQLRNARRYVVTSYLHDRTMVHLSAAAADEEEHSLS